MTHQHIDQSIEGLRTCTEQVRRLFSECSVEELNRKPANGGWSIGQCLDHLIVSNATYFSLFDEVAQGTKTHSFYERMPLLPSFFASMLIKSLKNPGMKAKTTAVFEPHSSIAASIVEDFARHNEQLIRKIESVRDKNLESYIITSPFASFVIYSMHNLLTIVVVHEQRHIHQAERVLHAQA